MSDFFNGIEPVPFKGPDTDDPLAVPQHGGSAGQEADAVEGVRRADGPHRVTIPRHRTHGNTVSRAARVGLSPASTQAPDCARPGVAG